ncbi:MAG: aldehyde dehydrogenase family protein, partial [Nocardioidaceae bacterium]|nr:aldehyde dehydrogenase family protein [Nocardioidaceae bacterium]
MMVAGRPVDGDETFEVRSPYDDAVVGLASWASPELVEQAVEHAHQISSEAANLPLHVRADALLEISRRISDRADELAELITAENGKPLMWARVEVGRAVSVFRLASEETRRWSGEVMRLDTDTSAVGRLAYVRKVPKGA